MGLLDRDYMRRSPDEGKGGGRSKRSHSSSAVPPPAPATWWSAQNQAPPPVPPSPSAAMPYPSPYPAPVYAPQRHWGRWIAVIALIPVCAGVGGGVWLGLHSGNIVVDRAGRGFAAALCYPGHCIVSQRQPAAQASSPAKALLGLLGVHVCAPQQFDARQEACTGSLRRFSILHLNVVRMDVTALHGRRFSTSAISLLLGTVGTDGHAVFAFPAAVAQVNVHRYNAFSLPVGRLFGDYGLHPKTGQTYEVQAQDNGTLLGTATFTVVR